MSQLAPQDLKRHLSLSQSDLGDDVLIAEYIDAAEARIARYVRKDLDATYPQGWPADLKQALRFLVAHDYENRDGAADPEAGLPAAVISMLAPHRDLSA